jgi:hypothetical protein
VQLSSEEMVRDFFELGELDDDDDGAGGEKLFGLFRKKGPHPVWFGQLVLREPQSPLIQFEEESRRHCKTPSIPRNKMHNEEVQQQVEAKQQVNGGGDKQE